MSWSCVSACDKGAICYSHYSVSAVEAGVGIWSVVSPKRLLRWWQWSSLGKCLCVIRPTGDMLVESRGQTPNARASELSLLTSARQRRLPAERQPLEKSFMVIVISLCCLNMFFSAQQPTLVDKAENWFCVSCKSELAHSRNIHINKVARSHTQTCTHSQSQTQPSANTERWTSSVTPAAQQIALCLF